jgi:hypothetical protein
MADGDIAAKLISGAATLISLTSLAVTLHTKRSTKREAYESRRGALAKQLLDNEHESDALIFEEA